MATLQFAYAGPGNAVLPAGVAEALPEQEWEVSVRKFEGLGEMSPAPDFIWVDLGKSPKLASSHTVLEDLARLQKKSRNHPFLFISGSALAKKAYNSLAEDIYAILSHPAEVVADLAGRPDFRSALAKFHAMRRKSLNRDSSTAAPAKPVPPSVPLPNADLRSPRGLLSIKRIAGLFGMDVIEIGRLIGRNQKAALSKTPDAESLQQSLQAFADIALLRASGLEDEAFRKWLRIPHEDMRNRAPIDWIREGRAADVAGFVYGILTGQPS